MDEVEGACLIRDVADFLLKHFVAESEVDLPSVSQQLLRSIQSVKFLPGLFPA